MTYDAIQNWWISVQAQSNVCLSAESAVAMDGMPLDIFVEVAAEYNVCPDRKLICAVIIDPQYRVWTGRTHPMAFLKASKAPNDTSPVENEEMVDDSLFMTSDGRLINRDGSLSEFGIVRSEEADMPLVASGPISDDLCRTMLRRS